MIKVKNMNNIIIDSLEYLKLSNYPVYVWGASPVSERVTKYYRSNCINIICNLVGKKYYKEGVVLDGVENQCFEDLLEKIKKNNSFINLIVGFGNIDKHTLNLIDDSHIKNIIVADFSTAFVLDSKEANLYDKLFWQKNRKEILAFRELLQDNISLNHFDEWIYQKRTSNRWKSTFTNDTYFDEDIINLSDNEVFVDVGAYLGETTEEYIQIIKKKKINFKKIFVLEPDKSNVKIVKNNLQGIKNIEIIEKGAWSSKKTLSFCLKESPNSSIQANGNVTIDVDTIDNILGKEKATFIKMDIEGSELEALKGTVNQIKDNKPKLAICIYHKKEDIITIPQFIKNIRSDYRFYFRNHSPMALETVLYAI